MKTLLLIRHGESEANRKRILASRLPYPLTEEGKKDARLIAEELERSTAVDRIISSPLVRARETAEQFAAVFKLPVETDERIAEQELGIYSGMSYDEVKGEKEYEADPLKRWDWVPRGGGESYAAIAERLLSFFRDLEDDREETLLIVTHAVAFRLIRAILQNTLPGYEAPFPNNGEIWKVNFTGTGNFHGIESLFLGNSRSFTHNP
ncbi:MAG: histidine phosphatase family protein [Spirochaetales bacterium]|nr:histidine phosphatase family protein [Spirochaetales bacterium]